MSALDRGRRAGHDRRLGRHDRPGVDGRRRVGVEGLVDRADRQRVLARRAARRTRPARSSPRTAARRPGSTRRSASSVRFPMSLPVNSKSAIVLTLGAGRAGEDGRLGRDLVVDRSTPRWPGPGRRAGAGPARGPRRCGRRTPTRWPRQLVDGVGLRRLADLEQRAVQRALEDGGRVVDGERRRSPIVSRSRPPARR